MDRGPVAAGSSCRRNRCRTRETSRGYKGFPTPGNLPRAGIGEQELPVLIDDNHAFPHAVENGFHEVGAGLELVHLSFGGPRESWVAARAPMEGKSRLHVQMELPRVDGFQHVAGERRLERRGEGPSPAVDQAHHGNVEPGFDPLPQLDPVARPIRADIDESQVRAGVRRFLDGVPRGRDRGAWRVSQTPQALSEA